MNRMKVILGITIICLIILGVFSNFFYSQRQRTEIYEKINTISSVQRIVFVHKSSRFQEIEIKDRKTITFFQRCLRNADSHKRGGRNPVLFSGEMQVYTEGSKFLFSVSVNKHSSSDLYVGNPAQATQLRLPGFGTELLKRLNPISY